MTEEELVKFIKTVYYTYDRTLVPKELKEYAVAWAPYIKEFPYEVAQQILPNVCMGEEYPPRPWQIRVALINYTKKIPQPPSSPQAWAQYQAILSDVTSGTQTQHSLHPAMHATLIAMQGVSLNNQFDAKRFETLYQDKVKEWFKKTYSTGMAQ